MLIEKKQKKRRNARREKFDSKILECQKQFEASMPLVFVFFDLKKKKKDNPFEV